MEGFFDGLLFFFFTPLDMVDDVGEGFDAGIEDVPVAAELGGIDLGE